MVRAERERESSEALARRSGNGLQMIYLSPVRWESYAQRPHFMIRHFLACGGRRVLWINPYPGRLPSLKDLQCPPHRHRQGTAPEPGIEIIEFPALPIEPVPGGFALNRLLGGRRVLRKAKRFAGGGRCILGIGKPSRLALMLLDEIAPSWSFYDAMDDFPSFHQGLSRAAMARTERIIGRRVDQILVSSSRLREKFSGGSAPVTCVPNAYDPGILPAATEPPQTKVFGYIGSIGEWFDWHPLLDLAAAMPALEIRLVGPCLQPPPRHLPANIRICPPCRHDRVGETLRQFRAGLIPFRINPLTEAVDPIKFYDYRAMGLPVISTRFGEMKRREGEEGLFFFEDDLGRAVANALNYRPDPGELLRWRNANTWENRFSAADPLRLHFGRLSRST